MSGPSAYTLGGPVPGGLPNPLSAALAPGASSILVFSGTGIPSPGSDAPSSPLPDAPAPDAPVLDPIRLHASAPEAAPVPAPAPPWCATALASTLVTSGNGTTSPAHQLLQSLLLPLLGVLLLQNLTPFGSLLNPTSAPLSTHCGFKFCDHFHSFDMEQLPVFHLDGPISLQYGPALPFPMELFPSIAA